MTNLDDLIQQYEAGPAQLCEVVGSLPQSTWDLTPIPNQWSIRQVVCHLADSEVIYADRIKRVIAEENPTVFEADPDEHAPRLYGSHRSLPTELELINAVRAQVVPILRHCDAADFQRTCVHSIDGPMTLETLIERIAGHIPHHLAFIQQKLDAMEI